MKIAVTGATGFLGRYIVRQLADAGHDMRCWFRATSNRERLESVQSSIEWSAGILGDPDSARSLIHGCDAVVHAALWRPGPSFQGNEGDIAEFAQTNILGTLQLMAEAVQQQVRRFVFVSTCAVHDKILDDRALDEKHPLWPASHYGAHKAALEKFVHSYGLGHGFPICAVRPTGIYGIAHPIEVSKWYDLIRDVVQGRSVKCVRGGKEVHAADVARSIELLLRVDPDDIRGESFNCCDRYISQLDVAKIARKVAGSDCEIEGQPMQPKHQIDTSKIRSLGMRFGGTTLLEETIKNLVDRVQAE